MTSKAAGKALVSMSAPTSMPLRKAKRQGAASPLIRPLGYRQVMKG